MRARSPDLPPPWFRCAICHRNQANHDAAEARVPAWARHEFVSVTTHEQRRRREKAAALEPTLWSDPDQP